MEEQSLNKKHTHDKTERERKKEQKSEIINNAMHETGILTTNAQPEKQYVIIAKKKGQFAKTFKSEYWNGWEIKEIMKPGNLRLKFDSNSHWKVWARRWPDKRGRDEGVAIDIELFLRNNEERRWGGCYFEFNEPRASSSTEKKWKRTRKCVEYQGERSVETLGKFTHCHPKRLRYRRKDHTLYSGQPRHRKTKNKEDRSGRKFEKRRVPLHD